VSLLVIEKMTRKIYWRLIVEERHEYLGIHVRPIKISAEIYLIIAENRQPS
jgi:hypothetical protein